MILAFFTGADCVPPIGYNSVTLNFNSDYIFAKTSTCAMELTLPSKHKDYVLLSNDHCSNHAWRICSCLKFSP